MAMTPAARCRKLERDLLAANREVRRLERFIERLWRVTSRASTPSSDLPWHLQRTARAIRERWGSAHAEIADRLDELARAEERGKISGCR